MRAPHLLLKATCPNEAPSSCFSRNTEVFYFFKNSKHNVPVEWRPGIIREANPHFVTIITDKGRKTSIAYENIRLRPQTKLSQELTRAT